MKPYSSSLLVFFMKVGSIEMLFKIYSFQEFTFGKSKIISGNKILLEAFYFVRHFLLLMVFFYVIFTFVLFSFANFKSFTIPIIYFILRLRSGYSNVPAHSKYNQPNISFIGIIADSHLYIVPFFTVSFIRNICLEVVTPRKISLLQFQVGTNIYQNRNAGKAIKG